MPLSEIARRRLRRLLLFAIALLYIVSVPWYRTTGAVPDVVLGLPDWVTVALSCYVGVAVLNSIAWWLTDVPDETPRVDSGESSP
jgi:hypothetical protein